MPTNPPTISALPTPPSRNDPSNFAARGDDFLGALPTLGTEINAAAANVYSNAVEVASAAATASTKAGQAADSAAAAAGSAQTASTKASEASGSATAAAVSAQTASTKAGQAADSAAAAAGSAQTASTKAGEASDSATSAAGSAQTASTKAGQAADSAAAAAGSAQTASTKAGEASNSATAAAGSAQTASTKAGEASSSAAAAASAWDAFDDRYLGAKPSDPTLDNDGHALLTGALYFNTSSNLMRVWTGGAWETSYAPVSGYQPLDADLTAIAAITDTSGLLRKTAANTWSLDSASYLTGISGSQVTTALGYAPENSANKGAANGYASLDAAGKVPSAQLPSYVDDVLEYANIGAFPETGSPGTIYVALDSNKAYRWSGSAYIEISASPGSTDAVVEGSTNLYFTTARARGSISATQNVSYDAGSGVITGPDLSGYLTGNQSISISGDASGSGATSINLTLANSGVSAGTYNDSATAVRPFTVDAKGRITAIGAAVTVTPAWGSISSKPSTLSGYGISDAQPALVSGTNIKTINGQSILGAGDLAIQGGVGVTLSGDAEIYVSQSKTYTITNYNVFSDYVVQVSAGSVSISGDQISFTAPSSSQTVTLTVIMDDNATEFSLAVQSAGVATPTNTSPSNNATDQNGTVTLTSSAFSWLGVSDTHLNSDWQLATDSAFSNVVQSTSADTTNKTSWTVSGLSTSQTYYWRVRHRGTNNGVSAWSTATSFVTKSSFSGLIGVQGQQGFGVGEYSGTLPSGFSALTGSSDKSSANYGNYQYSDGSIMVFVPRFYYRIGNASSPRYATYGANAVDIVGLETFATEAAANAAGYAMHRAFKDGGADKSGFFIDKYLASKNGTSSCKSVQNGVPISLTTSTSYTNSNGMTGCTGILADAVVLSRARGAGTFNVASVFMYSALAMLSLAHAQASSNTTYCAWYDATNNFPKGCNSGSLADTNDAGVTFTSAGDSGNANKPKTGSGSPFAKTTHNGQACGVADVNGSMWQVMLGITNAGSSATDTAQKTNGDAYVLKTSVALSSLTGGWNGTNDAWGDASNLANKYDVVSGLFPWGSTTGSVYFGNGSTQVFSGATSGTSYQRTAGGIQDTTNGTSASGTAQFGSDLCYQYNVANMFPLAAGHWGSAAGAGVFHRNWAGYRSDAYSYGGFRAAAYGS